MILPSSDVVTTGWTPTPVGACFSCLDEPVASDADFITTSIAAANSAIFGLASPVQAGTHTIDIRVSCSTGTAFAVVGLVDASFTTVAASAWQPIDTTLTTYSLSITTTVETTMIAMLINSTGTFAVLGALSLNGSQLSLNGDDLGLT